MQHTNKFDKKAFIVNQELFKIGKHIPEDELAIALNTLDNRNIKRFSTNLKDHFDELTIHYAQKYLIVWLDSFSDQKHQVVNLRLQLKTEVEMESEENLERLNEEMTLEEFDRWSYEKYGYIYAGDKVTEPLTSLVTFKTFDNAKDYLINMLPFDTSISRNQLEQAIVTSVQHGFDESIAIRLGNKSIFNHSGYVILLPKQ